jgi:hypothetical protein
MGHTWQCNMMQKKCELYAGLPRQEYRQTHTHNISYLLLFHGTSGYTNAPQCYAICKLPVLLPNLHCLQMLTSSGKRVPFLLQMFLL